MAVTALSAMVALSACGGGGGGGGGSTVSPPPVVSPPPPSPPPPPSAPPTPSATSTEYLRNYGLTNIHASAAYDAGATGAGITVAVVDSGVNHTQADIAANVSPLTTDIYTSRNAPDGEDNHGTLVAGIIGAGFNGFGTIGVAYKSTLLGVRIDSPGSCASGASQNPPATTSTCDFLASDIARGIDYAVANGARVINLSLGGPGGSLGSQFEAALGRAVAAGVVFTISAGNDSKSDPDYPARYATDPRYAGSILAVGSTDQSNTISSFSNMAGASAAEFVVAPGENVITGCDGTTCYRASGTSFSAPHVAGALALLLQAFPNLTGSQAIALLIQTADDLGAPGVDAVYGAGLIDLQKAFAPVGTLSTPTSVGAVLIREQLGSNLSAAFGDAIRRSNALMTVAYDSYNRLFQVNLADGFHAPQRTSLQGAVAPSPTTTEVNFVTAPGVSLSLAASRSPFPETDPGRGPGLLGVVEASADMRVALKAGALSLQAWRGQGGAPPAPGLSAAHDGFAGLARSDHAVRADYDFGGVTVGGEIGGGSRYTLYGLSNLAPSRYTLASLGLHRGSFAAQFSYGALDEPLGPLGSFLPGATSSFGMAASTRFVSLRTDWLANRRWSLSAEGSLGATRTSTALVGFDGAVVSSTWRITARGRCDDDNCLSPLLQIDQPVRIERGQFKATLADIPSSYDAPLAFSVRRFAADPSGRQIDLRLGFDRSVKGWGVLELQGVAVVDEANQAHAPLNTGVVASWRSQF
jgi:hypothetical protein